MVVHPRLVGVLLRGRSTWKALEETDYFVLQHHPRQASMPFRIVTRGFPHYRVAEGDSLEALQEELAYLSNIVLVSISGKITSKKISTWLKASFARNTIIALSPPDDQLIHVNDEDEYSSDSTDEDDDVENPLHPTVDTTTPMTSPSPLSSSTTEIPATDPQPIRSTLRRAISFEDASMLSTAPSSTTLTSGVPRQRFNTSLGIQSSPPAPNAAFHHLHNHRRDDSPASSSSSSSSLSLALASQQHQVLQPLRHHITHSSSLPVAALPVDSTLRTVSPEPNVVLYSLPVSSSPSPSVHSKSSKQTSKGKEKAASSVTLVTPEASPEELSDTSDELIIVEGGLLQEARSARSMTGSLRAWPIRHQTAPASSLHNDAGEGSSHAKDLGGDAFEQVPIDEMGLGPWSWLSSTSPLLDIVMNWIDGPEGMPAPPKSSEKEKPNPLLDIPFQFIALLTYPEVDNKPGSKVSLAVVRETAFVRQRRKTLLMLTAYTLVVRYCSFDFFLLVLFASNCGMLFLMKNSGRMNVNMAKRAVRQRVGWAKQWAGSIFRRGNNNNNNNNNTTSNNSDNNTINATSHRRKSDGSPNRHVMSFMGPSSSTMLTLDTRSSSSVHHIPLHQSNDTNSGLSDNNITMTAAETSPQIKKRGLLKRMTIGSHHSTSSNSANLASSSSIMTAASSSQQPPNTDGTSTTSKRRFFRRNNNNNTGGINSATPTVAAPIPTVPSNSNHAAIQILTGTAPSSSPLQQHSPLLLPLGSIPSRSGTGSPRPISVIGPSSTASSNTTHHTQSLPNSSFSPLRFTANKSSSVLAVDSTSSTTTVQTAAPIASSLSIWSRKSLTKNTGLTAGDPSLATASITTSTSPSISTATDINGHQSGSTAHPSGLSQLLGNLSAPSTQTTFRTNHLPSPPPGRPRTPIQGHPQGQPGSYKGGDYASISFSDTMVGRTPPSPLNQRMTMSDQHSNGGQSDTEATSEDEDSSHGNSATLPGSDCLDDNKGIVSLDD